MDQAVVDQDQNHQDQVPLYLKEYQEMQEQVEAAVELEVHEEEVAVELVLFKLLLVFLYVETELIQ